MQTDEERERATPAMVKIELNKSIAPFQQRLEIELSHLDFKDRKALSQALQLEILGIGSCVFFDTFAKRMEYERFVVEDPTPLVIDQLQTVLDRFNRRTNAQIVELPELEPLPILDRLRAWLNPQHYVSAAIEVCDIIKRGRSFEAHVLIHSCKSNVKLVQQVKDILAESPSCDGARLVVRADRLIIRGKIEPVRQVCRLVLKLRENIRGDSRALSPLSFYLQTIF